jgi:DNA-binding response OmpR family regulator
MNGQERRAGVAPERRAIPRGGRRDYDVPGYYPPVLIAEAYEEARIPCASYLQNLHFEVAEAAKPAEAIAMLGSGWIPHVILADPPSATAVRQHASALRDLTLPPLIVMTGALDAAEKQRGDVLIKPFRLTTMVQAVRRTLRRAARARTRSFGER